MTREEAIEILEETGIIAHSMTDVDTALDMAIEALKREPSEDLISRAEVVEISEVMLKTVTDQKIKIGISRLWQQIKDLPSADRPRSIEPTITVDLESGIIPRSAIEKRPHDVTVRINDLISRKEAIEAITTTLDEIDHVPKWVFEKLSSALETLPSIDK